MYLPLRMDGFGLTRHHGMASKKNQIHSRIVYLTFITSYYLNELETTQNKFDLSMIQCNDYNGDHSGDVGYNDN